MRRYRIGWVVAVAVGLLAHGGSAHAADLKATWKDGLRLESGDKAIQLKIGGRIHNDWAWFVKDAAVRATGFALTDGVEFRTARLFLAGVLHERLGFKAQYDFAAASGSFNTAGAFKDVYLELLRVPVVGTIRVGQFKEPFSLEELTSSNYITLMERALPNALVPGRSTGLMVTAPLLQQRMTWAAGVFRDTDLFGDNVGDGDYNLTARVTGLPWYTDGGRRLVHVGAAYRWSNPNGDTARFRARPESHLAPNLIDTGNFTATRTQHLGGEVAAVYGPLSIQGEAIYTLGHQPVAAKAKFFGFYTQASYFLTGEHRAYKSEEAAFTRLVPRRTAFVDGGVGAWELAARYSQLDVADANAGIAGGKLRDITAGVNWYLNPNARIMLNYVHGKRTGTGSANVVQTRFQIDF